MLANFGLSTIFSNLIFHQFRMVVSFGQSFNQFQAVSFESLLIGGFGQFGNITPVVTFG